MADDKAQDTGTAKPDAETGQLIIDPFGQYRYIDPTQAQEAVTTGGYRLPSPDETKEFALKQEHGNKPIRAFTEAALSGATFGGSRILANELGLTTPEEQAAVQKYSPIASGLGTAAGVVGPLLMPATGALGALSAPVRGVSAAGQAVAKAALPGAERLAASLTGKPLLQRIAAQAASQGLGSATEAAFYGAGESVNEAALGDPHLSAEKVMSNIGLSALMGGGLGGILGAGVGALARPETKAAIEAGEEMAAKAAAEAAPSGIPKPPPGTLSEIEKRIEAGKFKYPGTDMPAMGDVQDASSRVTDLDFPVNNVQLEALKSPEAHTFIKTMQETGEGSGPLLNQYEALQKRELVSKLNHEPVTLAPGHTITSDSVDAGHRVLKVAGEQLASEEKELAPLFKKFDDVATASISSPIEIVEAIGRAIPKAEKFIQVIPKEGEAATYKLMRYSADMGVSRKVYGAVKDILDVVNKPDQTIAGLRNARESIRSLVGALDNRAEIQQIGGLRRELMSYIGDQINKIAPELNVRDTFKRFAVNEEKRTILESIAGGSLKENAAYAKKAVPENVLKGIFSDTVAVQAARDLLGPEEFNKILADYVAINLHAATDGNAFYSNKFGAFLKNKAKVLDEAFTQQPGTLQRLKDLTMLSRRLPDAPKANPSGTTKTLNTLQKMKSFSEYFQSGGIHGVPAEISKRAAKTFENTENELMIHRMLAGKSMKEAQEASQFQAIRNIESTFDKGRKLLISNAKAIFEGGKLPSATPAIGFGSSKLASQFDADNSQELQAKIRQLTSDPEHLFQTLEKATASVSTHAPNLSGALSQKMATAVSFLGSKLPVLPPAKPLSPKYQPNKAETAQFNHYVAIIENPMRALEELKRGTLTPSTMEALQTVYPKLHDEMKLRLMDSMADYLAKNDKPVPYKTQLSLSLFMGQDMDNSLDQRSIASNQMALSPQAPPAQGGSKPVKSTQSGLSSITKSERMQTPVQAVASDKGE